MGDFIPKMIASTMVCYKRRYKYKFLLTLNIIFNTKYILVLKIILLTVFSVTPSSITIYVYYKYVFVSVILIKKDLSNVD